MTAGYRIAGLLTCLVVALILSACQSGYPSVPDVAGNGKKKTFTSVVYVPKPDGTLSAIDAKIAVTGNRPKAVLAELFRRETKFFPKGTKVIDVDINSTGLAVVDLNRNILDKEVANQKIEALGLGSIVRTVAEDKSVKQVKITVEGRSRGNIGGRSIDRFWGFNSLKLQPFAVK